MIQTIIASNKFESSNSTEQSYRKTSKNMQNIIVFKEPNDHPVGPNWKLANLYTNRITIDEDAAFELLGVFYLKKSYYDLLE